MKDTIRLSQRNKDRLSAWDDDGNKAIELALDAYDRLSIKDATREEFKGLLQYTAGPQTAVAVAAGNLVVPSREFSTGASYNATPTVSHTTTFVPDMAYWKKLESTVDNCIEKAKRY